MTRQIFSRLLLFVLMLSSAASFGQIFGSGPRLESLDKFSDGRFQFQSVRSVHWHQVVSESRQYVQRTDKVWVPARLYMPKRPNGKVPAVVIQHGIGGLYYRDGRIRPYVEYAELLAQAGIAALVLDTHGGRGVGATRQLESSQVSVYTFVADVFTGAEILRSHPGIDGDRIGVMGFSKGGSTALLATDRRFVEAFSNSRTPFAMHLAVYPGCQTFPEYIRATRAPVLFLLGEKDNYTGTSGCFEIENKLKSAGTKTQLITYPGAFHSWDEDTRPFRVEDVSTADCRWILKDGGGVWGGGMNKPIESAAEGEAYFRSCVKPDEIFVGRVESAYRAGLKDVVEFARSTLQQPTASGLKDAAEFSRNTLQQSTVPGAVKAEGFWVGRLMCSANTSTRAPEYSAALSISVTGNSGSTTLEDNQITEQIQMSASSDGLVRIESQGSWKSAPERRWSIRTEGRIEGNSLRTSGVMYASDGRTVVRDRCVIELANQRPS